MQDTLPMGLPDWIVIDGWKRKQYLSPVHHLVWLTNNHLKRRFVIQAADRLSLVICIQPQI